jgi:hypothetical protein
MAMTTPLLTMEDLDIYLGLISRRITPTKLRT